MKRIILLFILVPALYAQNASDYFPDADGIYLEI